MNAVVLLLLHVLVSFDPPTARSVAKPETGATTEFDDVLSPEKGILFESAAETSYQLAVVAILLPNTRINRECQMVTEGSTDDSIAESAIFIERDIDGRNPAVVRRVSQSNIRKAVTDAMVNKARPEGAPYWPYLKSGSSDVREFRASLSEETATVLAQSCEMMLETVHYPSKAVLSAHARTVHFAHHTMRKGYRTGKGLGNNGRVGKFTRLLERLGTVATSPPEKRLAAEKEAKNAATVLVAEMHSAGIPIPAKEDRRAVPSPDQP